MNIGNLFKTFVLITFSVFMLSACEEGPAEETGEKIDESVRDIKEATKNLGDDIKDTSKDIADDAEDVCDEATDGNC